MLSGDIHTVPVGYEADGAAHVVMDILLFDYMTAEQSIAHANKTLGAEPQPHWGTAFAFMEETVVPLLRAASE
jgi:hypothetical protein